MGQKIYGEVLFEIALENIVEELNEQHGREKQDAAMVIPMAIVFAAVVLGVEIPVVEVLMHPYKEYVQQDGELCQKEGPLGQIVSMKRV